MKKLECILIVVSFTTNYVYAADSVVSLNVLYVKQYQVIVLSLKTLAFHDSSDYYGLILVCTEN